MLKRLRWLLLGAALGVGGPAWLKRKARAAGYRYRPAGMAEAATQRARAALEEGREAMHQREAELRAGRRRVSRRAGRP